MGTLWPWKLLSLERLVDTCGRIQAVGIYRNPAWRFHGLRVCVSVGMLQRQVVLGPLHEEECGGPLMLIMERQGGVFTMELVLRAEDRGDKAALAGWLGLLLKDVS